jgi:hypothetical protein
MDDTYPKRVSDPSAEGLPDYTDDDSTAFDDVQSPRVADGPDPWPLTHDRDTAPQAMDDFGTTAEEQRQGAPLDLRLAREEPDITPDAVAMDPSPDLADEAVGEAAAGQVVDDTAVLAEEAPVDPRVNSAVSMYDRLEAGVPEIAPLGRLIQPDEGLLGDTESTEVAVDKGAAGGGPSAEELAMHQIPPEEVG